MSILTTLLAFHCYIVLPTTPVPCSLLMVLLFTCFVFSTSLSSFIIMCMKTSVTEFMTIKFNDILILVLILAF